MKRITFVVASLALVGVCTVSRWCSEMQNDVDKLVGRRS